MLEEFKVKFDTLIKLGSLAFGVAQDEKVRELLNMEYKGVNVGDSLTHHRFRRHILVLKSSRVG